MDAPTAAILLVGEELLSGKVADTNAAYLIGRLRELGVQLRHIAVVGDEPDAIAREVTALARRFDHVFTSGGIGPTHDDVTMESIAHAFGVGLDRNPLLVEVLTQHFGERLTDDHLRMSEAPAGAEMITGGTMRWPVIRFQNIYILPGVPQIFRDKFDAIAERFRARPFALRSVYLNTDEGNIAAVLRGLESTFEVRIGSYPRWDAHDYRVRVTFEAYDAVSVNAAVDALIGKMPTESLVRADAPVDE